MSEDISIKGVGLLDGNRNQHFDHVIPVCELLGIPIIFHVKEDEEIAHHFYPQVDSQFVPWKQVTLDYMKERYAFFINSELIGRGLQKDIRHVYCPHGMSDKFIFLARCAFEDITLVYGQYMLDQFAFRQVTNQLQAHVITGNLRYTYFKKHQDFFRQLVDKDILSQFAKKQPIITYAPTWGDYDDGTTLFDYGKTIIHELPDHYNLIIKIHSLVRIFNPDELYSIMQLANLKPNVVVTIDFLPVYPILDSTDIFIGDSSSVGYDFLTFNRPMFFINKHQRDSEKDKRHVIVKAGVEVHPYQIAHIYSVIEQNLAEDQARFGATRQQLYQYAFGEERTDEAIRHDIFKCVERNTTSI